MSRGQRWPALTARGDEVTVGDSDRRSGPAGLPALDPTRPRRGAPRSDELSPAPRPHWPRRRLAGPRGRPSRAGRSLRDAFFAQGFVHAQDRLWHMEYDRRRAAGRWAEYVGEPACRRTPWRGARPRGARASTTRPRPPRRGRCSTRTRPASTRSSTHDARPGRSSSSCSSSRPEPWAPWDSLAVFKVRHVEMGPWQMKLWRARLVRHLGLAAGRLPVAGHSRSTRS